MTSNQFCNLLDRIEVLGDLSLPALRIIADYEQGSKVWSRGKCLSEIIDCEFGDLHDRDYSEKGRIGL